MNKDLAPKDVLDLCAKEGVRFIDLRFMDFPGLMQALAGYLGELLGRGRAEQVSFSEAADEEFRFGLGTDASVIEGCGQLAEVLFDRGPTAAETLPEGELGELLGQVFPLPALRYDLTFA